ncbi:class I SAM-dependent methyltransferase [Candidatus Saccharibacteria bacterium]|jgi:ubiquinone/menaquinone biosynthesis C-methylase UbiE|nr:class I SAM-dependent methyltransferase [Candidatus Saccharibacteria bacterium]
MYSRANQHLICELSGTTPGNALDAGCGKGSDAIWLAKQGWQVTAVDISESVLKKAKNLAKAAGVSVNFEKVDLTTWSPTKNYYDLVSSAYVHTTDDRSYISKISRAVKPGGILMIIGHQPPEHGEKDAFAHGSHLTAEEISSFLDSNEWEIEIAEPREIAKEYSEHYSFSNDSIFKVHRKLS